MLLENTQKPIILSRLFPRFHCPPSTDSVTLKAPGSFTVSRNLGLDDRDVAVQTDPFEKANFVKNRKSHFRV